MAGHPVRARHGSPRPRGIVLQRSILHGILCVGLLCLAGSLPASAQQTARLTGTVADETGRPVEYALVGLVAADDTTRQYARTLTDDAGRYAFSALRPGRYRLRVSRIGYASHVGPAFELTPGEPRTRRVAVRSEPITIDALVVGGRQACHALDVLAAAAPDVARLWTEAAKGIEIKRAFLRGYRHTLDLRMETHQDNRLLRDVHDVETRTITLPPDSVAVSDPATPEQPTDPDTFGERGTASLTLTFPQERVVTDPVMLRGYCIEEDVTRSGDGALGLHFRPADPDRGGVTAEGVVFVEEDDYRLRGLTYHDFSDGRYVGTGGWVYGNVPVPGAVLRLPVSGSLDMQRVPLPLGLLIRGFELEVTYEDYRDFQPLDRPAPPASG